MATDLKFAVEALTGDRWVITVSEAARDPVHLIGLYVSEHAANKALPRTTAAFLELYTLRRLQTDEREHNVPASDKMNDRDTRIILVQDQWD